MHLHYRALIKHAARLWDTQVLPTLRQYIEIPALSPEFDKDWKKHEFIDQAMDLAMGWVSDRAPHGTICEIIELEGRTPLLFIDVPATGGSEEEVLLYSHLDKQPPFKGWRPGLEAWTAVDVHDEQGHRLYGRGGADDGYGVFAAITAIQCLEEQNIPHARCVMIVETSEESGSPDLPFYVEYLKDRIGTPSLIIALDSGCGDYRRVWITPSLRGIVQGVLRVEVLTEGVHSGDATGFVPDPFRIGRALIQSIEYDETGLIKIGALHAVIPPEVREQAQVAASALGFGYLARFPWAKDTCPIPPADGWLASKILARTWEPGLSVVGIEGMPGLGGGSVRLPELSFKLSIRIPPTVNADVAARAVEAAIAEAQTRLTCRANITFKAEGHASWLAPAETPWFTHAVERASLMMFDAPPVRMGEGGSIPFMGQLGEAFPQAQFFVTGVLGPESNAHGPNEFLHVDYAKGLTVVVASVLGDHADHFLGDSSFSEV